MAYQLTLTSSERRAMDFVGDRYPEGHDLFKILCGEKVTQSPEEADWDSKVDITYTMPEHVAWEIRDLLEGEDSNYGAALFAPAFREKLMEFCDKIV